ncbi:MAG: ATP-binding protein [Acidobacteriota bacterium]
MYLESNRLLALATDRLLFLEGRGMRNKLIWLIASRLTVILILLGTAYILNLINEEPNKCYEVIFSLIKSKQPISCLVNFFIDATLVTAFLSIVYSTAIRFSTRYSLQAYGQIFTDILLISWIVYHTLTTEKSFAALYLVVVLAAITVLPRVGVLTTALLCVIAYLSVIGLIHYGVINSEVPYLNPEQSAPLYILAMLVIGALGGQISERLRRSHLELEQATQHLANLQAFNERIIESIHSGLVTTDIEGKLLSFNRAAEELCEYKANQAINKNFSDIFGDQSAHITFGPKALEITRSIRFTTICKSARGRQMHLGITASPLFRETGEITGLVFSFQDLTEIMKLEQQVRRRDRLAAMGKMAAGIAHEIRNPLAAMRGSIQVLRSELALSEDQNHLMQIVLRESDRLDKIVSDFLAYARPTPAKPIEFDLVILISETVSLLRYSSELNEKHQVVTECPAQFLFVADANQIRQIIWNLARNAVQAMPDGGTLKIGLQQTERLEVELSFEDTGIGMSGEEMERMFEPFNSSRPGGTGLGLAIVYQIVSDHNGKINVESQPHQGTKIAIHLPSPGAANLSDTDIKLIDPASIDRLSPRPITS